jgi:hypothetical protein
MKSKVIFSTVMIGMLLVAATVSMEAQAATSAVVTKEQSNTHANGTHKRRKRSKVKKAARGTEKGTEDTGKGIAKGGEKTGEDVAKGSEKAAEGTADGVKDASKATAKGVGKAGKATGKAARKVGRAFK